MFPLAVWQPGTLQPSTPVNDNALRVEILQRGATSIISTPPGSPADGQVHIVGASPTGAWAAFAENDVVLWRSGTWYRFAPFAGWLKQVGSDVRRFDGSAWVVVTGGGGGGAVPVQEEGTTVVASPTAINFVGAGVMATNSSGVATVTIPGGGGGTSFDPTAQAWGLINGNPATTALAVSGLPITLTFVGTAAFRDLNFFGTAVDAISRVAVTAAASTTAVCGWRSQSTYFGRGPSANIGGFTLSHRIIIGNGGSTASHRFFAGVRESLSDPTDVNPSTLTNIVGFGYDSADTQWQFMHNDGSGTATKIALGAGLPKPSTVLTKCYDIEITAIPGGAVQYRITDVFTGDTASGSVTTNLPNAANGLSIWEYLSAGGTSTAVSLESSFWFYRIGKARA